MTFSAVLFDLDGTLLDTLRDIADSVNSALEYFGFPQHELDAYRYFVGNGTEMLARRAVPEDHRDQATVSKVLALINEMYSMRWANNTRPFPGITELLNGLRDDGTRMAILSNKGQRFAEATVSTFLRDWHFECVVGARPGVPKKPDPTAAFEIAGLMGLATDDFLYVGDSGVDMKTAVAAGMYPVGALWGYRTADELVTDGARAVIDAPPDVLLLVGRRDGG